MKTQLTKILKSASGMLILTGLITFGCGKKNPDVSQNPDSTNKSLPYIDEKLKSAGPVSSEECDLMFEYRDQNYKLKPPTSALNFNQTKVRLSDFLHFINSNTNVNVNALRFYPSFSAPDKIFLTMTKAYLDMEDDTTFDSDHTALLLNNYTITDHSFPGIIDSAIASSYVRNFFNSVSLRNMDQTNSMIDFKKSRTFMYTEIDSFLKANIGDFDSQNPDLYNEYKLQFEIGYTDSLLSRRFYERVAANDDIMRNMYNNNSFLGFTVIISIIDNTGALLRDNIPGKNPYTRKALEIAHVCPPVCGDLY
jgi:hypothetical protein